MDDDAIPLGIPSFVPSGSGFGSTLFFVELRPLGRGRPSREQVVPRAGDHVGAHVHAHVGAHVPADGANCSVEGEPVKGDDSDVCQPMHTSSTASGYGHGHFAIRQIRFNGVGWEAH
jgi:hypothetical protein